MLSAALHLREIEVIVHGVPKAFLTKLQFPASLSVRLVSRKKFRFKLVALGGTFDFLHKGHHQFLAKAFAESDIVVIGVTSDKLVKELGKRHRVQPYRTRVRELRRFLESRGWSKRSRISPLQEPFGPAAKLRNLEALVVTPDSARSGRKLNLLRKRKGLRTVKIVRASLARGRDGKVVSSTRIRNGEIDREGRVMHWP